MSVFDDLTWQGRLFQTVQRKKKISDHVSAFTQKEYREWKHHKKSIAGGLVCKLSGVQSDRRERSS